MIVIQRPLEAEWAEIKAKIEEQLAKAQASKAAGARTRARNEASNLFRGYLDRLRAFRVLDPACGSGNFLYLALQTLKDLEHRASIEAEALGLPREFPRVGPEQLLGIEINPYAAELARVSVWIGEIQWMQRNGFGITRNPILRPLDTIECRDAILNPDGTEADWPDADIIVGNPPFLGDKLMISVLGEKYVTALRTAYAGRVPGGADLVCYWFDKARTMIVADQARHVGLVATNSIRGGANRAIVDRIRKHNAIFEAWSDEEWTVEGAAVRVSLVCFAASGDPVTLQPCLNGLPVTEIFADLTGGPIDLTAACRLSVNRGVSFIGRQKDGPVDIPGELARQWVRMPLNPNNRSNTDVVHPWMNGADVTRRPSGRWLIDFKEMSEAEASLYEAPFEYARLHLRPIRLQNRDRQRREMWWRPGRSGADLRRALWDISRYIATPRVGTHRLFVWLHAAVVPDCQLVVIARDDDTTFGIVHSWFHEVWVLRLCTWLGVGNDPRYTPSTTFETFPFPEGLTPNIPAESYADDPRSQRIAAAARRLNELREAWLNPPDLGVRVPEVVPGYPDRVLPKDEDAAKELKKRTLTKLYNQRPAWLDNIHKELDAAVAAAYGWPAELSDDEILARLLELNQARAGRGAAAAA
jgi:type II restriction/modification system DNA methylase subunit YeeA